jgi:carbon starvation protein
MLVESFVAIMAMVAACVLDPSVYFAMNAPAALIGTTSAEAAHAIAQWGFPVSPELLDYIAKEVGEKTILSRAGGAPTLAVGMAQIFSRVIGGPALAAFWYHFAILFEALFILTTVDAGTRVTRFMIQDLLGGLVPVMKETGRLVPNLVATALAVGAWGYFLHQGVTDPLGGINTLWPLFGISNQMLAAIALTVSTVLLFKMKRERYAWVTMLPAGWLLVCTLTAGWQKIFDANPKIGFLAHSAKLRAAAERGEVVKPAANLAEMRQIIFNDQVDAAMCAFFVAVVVGIALFGLVAVVRARRASHPTAQEVGHVATA